MDLYLKNVGKKIRKARQSKGVALRKLGELCDLDYSNICRLEQGLQDVRLSTLKIVADALGKSVKDFL